MSQLFFCGFESRNQSWYVVNGYEVTARDVGPAVLFEAIANGSADASFASWLPTTCASFYEKHQDNIVDLGENLTGAKNGLVVPSYVDINSIEELEPKE